MYEDPCLLDRYLDAYRGKPRAELDARRAAIIARSAELENYSQTARLSKPQLEEQAALIAEQIAVDDAIKADDVQIHRSQIEAVKRAAADPANCESGDGGGMPGAPAYVRRTGDQPETPGQVIQRIGGNPWRHGDDTAAGLISRAHSAIEGQAGRLTSAGAEQLAGLLAERDDRNGIYEYRTLEDVRRSAALITALSSPYYESGFRAYLRNPEMFRTGGALFHLSDDERHAFSQAQIARAALVEDTSTTGGGFLLPLTLDDTIILSNAGVASPFRQRCRIVQTTSNQWRGVVSAGASAAWLAESGVAADATPTLTALDIPVFKEALWMTASFEEIGDTRLSANVPALIQDARQRIEGTAFAVGTGTTQPWGIVSTHATSDSSTGALALAKVFGLHSALPPRFRLGDADPVWLANVANMDVLRQVALFTGSTQSLVDDSGPVTRMLGNPFLEASAMSAVNTTGAKNLAYVDMRSYVIADRLGTEVIYDPLLKDQATARPLGQGGWFAYARAGADLAVATACQYHTV